MVDVADVINQRLRFVSSFDRSVSCRYAAFAALTTSLPAAAQASLPGIARIRTSGSGIG